MRNTLFGILILSAVSFPQTPAPMPMPVPPLVRPAYDAVRQFLVLSEAQVKTLEDLVKSRRDAESAIYRQMSERQRQLNSLLESGSNDAATIGRLMVEINNLRKQIPNAGVGLREAALKVLNDTQRAKLKELENALLLQRTAGEAVALNLLDYPRIPDARILPAPADVDSATVVSEP